jgi:putative transcriptional regulator
MQSSVNLSCKLLVANSRSNFLNDAVVLIVSHDADGALGFALNQSIGFVSFTDIFRLSRLHLPIVEYAGGVNLLSGGVWNKEKAFVIHSSDYKKDILFNVNQDLLVSSNQEIIEEIARGKGPSQKIILSGVSRWLPGELETELINNNWMISAPVPEIIFSNDVNDKWTNVLAFNGVSPVSYINKYGNC